MGGDNANSISEFEPVSPPADLHSSPSSPATQFLQGTADSAIDAAVGTAHLIADSAKAAYDIATTPEGKDAAWETAKSMLNDAAQFAKDAFSLTPLAPQEWQDDAKQRFQEWLINRLSNILSVNLGRALNQFRGIDRLFRFPIPH